MKSVFWCPVFLALLISVKVDAFDLFNIFQRAQQQQQQRQQQGGNSQTGQRLSLTPLGA